MKIKCSICKKEKDSEDFLNERLRICSTECFSDNFWNTKVECAENNDKTFDDLPVARINGEHYVLDNEDSINSFRGCAGQEFFIKFLSGEHKDKVFRTTNLWCQGTIPDEYKDALPDNAEFVEPVEEFQIVLKEK